MSDFETGEINMDYETGERLAYAPVLNQETGEPEPTVPIQKRITFKVPNPHASTKSKKTCTGIHHKNHDTNKLETDRPNEVFPILLFLLPTLCMYPFITILSVALEVVIHMWAHKKNKTLKDGNFYYKSPLHIVASKFCAKCRDHDEMGKIGRIQERRLMQYEYFKRMCT